MSTLNRTSKSTGVTGETRSIGERGRSRKQKGQALIEFALVVPVLLLVVTGITTFSIYLAQILMLTDAVSVGARFLSINRGQTTDPCNLTAVAIENAAPKMNFTQSGVTFSYVLNGASYSGTSCSSSSTTTGAAGNLVQGKNAKVTVVYPCSLIVYGHNFAPSCNFTVQTTEIVQ